MGKSFSMVACLLLTIPIMQDEAELMSAIDHAAVPETGRKPGTGP